MPRSLIQSLMAVPPRDTRMDVRRACRFALLALATLLGAYALAPRASGQEYVPTADPSHPRVRYADSLVSLNDRCPVRGGKLSPSYKPVYVNRHPIGFC